MTIEFVHLKDHELLQGDGMSIWQIVKVMRNAYILFSSRTIGQRKPDRYLDIPNESYYMDNLKCQHWHAKKNILKKLSQECVHSLFLYGSNDIVDCKKKTP